MALSRSHPCTLAVAEAAGVAPSLLKRCGVAPAATIMRLTQRSGAGGVGGDALSVNGFGSEASIFGGNFVGGTGLKGDGLSLNVLNNGVAHVRGGTFGGDMVARSGGTILLYGCFKQDGDVYRGVFEDETELVVTARTTSGGDVIPVAIAEVECEDAPSTEPTNYPTVSPRPTVPRPSGSCRHGATAAIYLLVGIHFLFCLLKS